jgi:O-antigen/teichoic acid export membrane protein
MPFPTKRVLAAAALGPEAAPGSGDVTFPEEFPADGSSPLHSLFSSKSARGGMFLAARYGLGAFVSLGNMLVMTWWIGPHAYGLFVTAVGLVTFLGALARMGVDIYLIRCPSAPSERVYGVATALILIISTSLTLAGAALIPLLVRWYGNGEFVAPYIALLLTIPLTALTGIPGARLERDLSFISLAGIELGGQTLGLVLAAVMALCGPSVWAPVSGYAGWQIFILAGTYFASGAAPRLNFDARQAREMLAYGVGLTASVRAWQLRTLINPLLVGRFAGADGVAFVGVAIRIAEALGTFRRAAGRLAIAALARMQHRRVEFQAALERALCWQVVSLGPLLCGFALVGPLAVRHVLGMRWLPSLALYPFIAAGVLVNSLYNLQASALFVLGRQWVVMRSYALHIALLGAGTFVLLPHLGIAGYGWAELLACAGYWPIHAGLKPFAALSYRRIWPWLVIFLALLFGSLANPQGAGVQLILVPTPLTPSAAGSQSDAPANGRRWPVPRENRKAA